MLKQVLGLVLGVVMSSNSSSQVIDIIATSDVHGNFLPYDFIEQVQGAGSLARVSTFIKTLNPETTILLDNGDLLQGQPPVYYYNYVDTASEHLGSQVLNYMGYDAATIGNHDVETGHQVYDRLKKEFHFPLLGANVIDVKTGEPYLTPYTLLDKGGKKIAILGLITPAIPAWLPKSLWEGLRFEDMETTAQKWMPIIQAEKPDLVIGLFHSGNDAEKNVAGFNENASIEVAKNVPGFNLVITGHDHIPVDMVVEDVKGNSVVVLNPGANAMNVAHARVRFGDGLAINSKVEPVTDLEPDKDFVEHFYESGKKVKEYVDEKIGIASGDFSSQEAFFGPSAYMSLLHKLQLAISDADISLAAPLSKNTVIKEGDITIADLFKLYKYENSLYVINLSGQEIKNYLEKSYALWTRQLGEDSREGLLLRKNPSYNFDSAQGIDYEVDVTKPEGEKVTIFGFSNGSNFNPDATYRVAVNSYRAEGGGGLLTEGAGIAREDLAKRVIWRSERDLRHYLVEQILNWKKISPEIERNWKFVPENIVSKAVAIDRDPEMNNR